MSTYWRRPIVCECGHKGSVRRRESDWSSDEWFNLEGFAGGHLEITNGKLLPDDLLAAMTPKCPQCRRTGKASYAGNWTMG
jgi:hypothetical protein